MKTLDQITRKILLCIWAAAAIGGAAVPSACARKPKDKVAYGQTEFMYNKTDVLSAHTTFLSRSESQDFTRKPFERIDGEWLELDKLSDVQQKLIKEFRTTIAAKLKEAGTNQVRFTATKDMIFLGLKGYERKTFAYSWHTDGYYNLRKEFTKNGEKTNYIEVAQEGAWNERELIRIGPNTVGFPIKISDEDSLLTFERSAIDGKSTTFAKSVIPQGFTAKNWESVYSFYNGRIPEGAAISTKIVNNYHRAYWLKKSSDGRTMMVEIARLPARLGFVDYTRDANDAPVTASLRVVVGESVDPSLYDAAQLGDENYPQVADALSLAFKEDFLKSKTLSDLPNLEIQSKIMSSLKDANVNEASPISVTLNEQYLDVTVIGVGGAEGTTFRWNITSNANYSGLDTIQCDSCQTLTGGAETRVALFQVDSSQAVTPLKSQKESLNQTLEYTIQKSDVKDRVYLYYPVIVDSSSEDPNLGGGQVSPGGWGRTAQRKVIFSFDREFLTVKAAPGSVKTDPKNNDLPILKYPIRSHFSLRYDPVTKKYFRDTSVRWQDAEYADVDFASNTVTNFFNDNLTLEKFQGAYVGSTTTELLEEPLNRYIDAPNKYLYVDRSATDKRFLSFLTQYSVTPNPLVTGSFEYPVTLKIRNGFLELKNESGYQAKPYDFYDFHTFNLFTTEVYKPQDDFLQQKDSDYRQYASLFDIDPARGKSVTYTLNRDFPAEFCSTAFAVAEAWNTTFQKAFQNDSYTFVKLAEATEEDLNDPIYAKFQGKCQKADGTYAIPLVRDVGDLRANMIVLFSQNMGNGLAGFGPTLKNPDTGEVLSGSSFLYEHALRSIKDRAGNMYDYMKLEGNYAQYVHNRIKWMDPENSGSDLITGTSPKNLVAAPNDGIFQATPIDVNAVLEKPAAVTSENKVQIKAGSAAYRDLRSQLISELESATDVGDDRLNKVMIKTSADILASVSGISNTSSLVKELNSVVEHRQATNQAAALADADICVVGAGFNPTASGDYYRSKLAENPAMTRDEFIREAVQSFYFSVTVHEMGHNFGLRHNFRGSVDKANFTPKFQELSHRTDLTDAEKYSIKTYESSTVMEYMPTFIGGFYEGTKTNKGSLGSYDVGAIAYAYKGELQASPVPNTPVDRTKDFDATYAARITRQAYRERMQGFINESLKGVDNAGNTAFGFVDTLREELSIRPYMYCTDGGNSLDDMCAQFDSGTRPTEIMQNAVDDYESSYKIYSPNNGMSASPYMGGIGNANDWAGSSFASRIKQFYDTYEYYSAVGPYPDTIQLEDGVTLGDYKNAALIGLKYLQKTVKQPSSRSTATDNAAIGLPFALTRDDYPITRNLEGDTLIVRRGTLLEKRSIMALLTVPGRSSKVLYDADGKILRDKWNIISSGNEEIRSIADDIMSDFLQGSAVSAADVAVDATGVRNVIAETSRTQVNLTKNFLLDIPTYAQLFVGYFGNTLAHGSKLNASIGYQKICGTNTDFDYEVKDSELDFEVSIVPESNCRVRFAKETGVGFDKVFAGVKEKIRVKAKISDAKRRMLGTAVSKASIAALSPAALLAASANQDQLKADAFAKLLLTVRNNLALNDANVKYYQAVLDYIKENEIETVEDLLGAFNKGDSRQNTAFQMNLDVFEQMAESESFSKAQTNGDATERLTTFADLGFSWDSSKVLASAITLRDIANLPATKANPEVARDLAAWQYLSAIYTQEFYPQVYEQNTWTWARDANTVSLSNYLSRLDAIKKAASEN